MDQPLKKPDTIETALSGELMRGERVLWQGRATGRFRPSMLGIWLFAIPWTAFAVFWTLMAAAATAIAPSTGSMGWIDWIFPLFGTPFILVGLGMMAVPFVAPRKARRTLFAVTDQRVLRLYRGRTLEVQSLPAGQIGSMERIETRDGSGTLKIALAATGDGGKPLANYFVLGEVPNIRQVESRLRELQRHAARAGISS